ncbi:MAG: alpha,alpha-trehalose-phosphate synthase (UDP-forming), partial [Bacteriovoracia bacterium]
MSASKWIIVSNRLPFKYDAENDQLQMSSGGLVTAISGIHTKTPILWVGSTTDEITMKKIEQRGKKARENISYHPILMDNNLYNAYYNGMGNDVIWPAFHYEADMIKFEKENWDAYVKANQIIADNIVEVADDNDLIWVHDFHLFLVPGFIKKKRKNLKVGFFLHIPFPSSEIYRQLPVREKILESLITADLVGFHDHSYLRHFCSAVYNILGINSSLLTIEHNQHVTQLGVYPVSIDTQGFMEKARSAKTASMIKKLHLKERGGSLILGVDRLDYIKGIELKLHSFRNFLKKYPEYIGKVHFFQIAVPSRQDVDEYKKLREDIERLVGQINGEFSTPTYIPVQYMFNSVSNPELMALYRRSSVLFIGSKRDGMKLVSLEYVSTQQKNNPGVVILSEFAGAVSTLSHVIKINPWDFDRTADALHKAVTMPLEDRKKRHAPMLKFLESYNSSDWAKSFMDSLAKHKLIDERQYQAI